MPQMLPRWWPDGRYGQLSATAARREALMTNTDPAGDDFGDRGGAPSRSGPDGVELLKRFGPSALLLAILVWFVLANTQEVTVRWLFWTTEAPLIVVLVVTAVVGALITLLMQRRGRRRG